MKKIIKDHKLLWFFTFLSGVGITILNVGVAYVIGRIIDTISTQNMERLKQVGIYAILLFIGYIAVGTLYSYLASKFDETILKDTKSSVLRYLTKAPIDEYQRKDVSYYYNLLTQDMDQILTNYIQKLDPVGVGARDLKECLLIQLENKNQTETVELAHDLLSKSFDAFTKKHYKKLMQKHGITEDELRDAISEVEHLNPKPGKAFGGNTKIIEHIVPDFTIRIINGELDLSLNGRNTPQLYVSREYSEMFDTYKKTEKKSKDQKKAVLFVKQKLDAAKWFIDAIIQRQNTLMITMEAIMDYQREYFLTGDEREIRPMILKDIAEIIDMDISTVSRVANSKYVNTPYGTFLIKDLFSESMTNEDGEEVSTREIKRILEDIVDQENKLKPLTDEKLAKMLKEKGYAIARRTVAKYREQLNIPVARLRKEI